MSSIALHASSLANLLAARAPRHQQIAEVFLVGCGGSLVDLYPGRFFLATEAQALRTELVTANEFVHAVPRALGDRSVVIVCSHGGATPESVAAARIAKSRGSLTVTLTHNDSAEIAGFSDHNIVYDWGDESNVASNPMAIALALCLEVLHHAESYAHYDDFRTAITQIDAVVATARDRIRERARAFAEACQDAEMFYVLSSGASFGHAWGFANCSLMEMQWLDAAAIHSGEFFHGPFEITDPSTNFIVLLNAGRTRPLDERVIAFLGQHARNVAIVDARELGIGALPGTVVEYFNPVLFYSVLCDYREALATIRDHPLDTRRYMGKVDY